MRWGSLIKAGLAGALLAAGAQGALAQSRAAMLDAMGAHAMQAADGSGPARDVCVYCHTPTGAPGAAPAPAWQSRSAARSFEAYDSRGEGGRVSIRTSVSAACLSCHDGALASNVAPNTPGRAGHGGGALMTVGSNDHPVGVPLSDFGGRSLRAPGDGAPRLRSARIGDEIRWWIDSEPAPNGARDRSDIILYTRHDQGVATPYIECASCHDPHANARNKYLRTSNGRSMLCFACHGA